MEVRKLIRYIYTSVTFIIMLTIALPVLAYVYYADFSVVESSGNSYTMMSGEVTANNTYLVAQNYIDSTGLDTRVFDSGIQLPHMVVDNRTMFATDLNAYETKNLIYATGDPLLSSTDIICGYGGYITTTDHADLEPSNNSTVQYQGYVDVSTTSYLVRKEGSITLQAIPNGISGNVSNRETDEAYRPSSDNITIHTPVGASNNWECIDEAVHDSDATYVRDTYSDGTYRFDTYGVPAVTLLGEYQEDIRTRLGGYLRNPGGVGPFGYTQFAIILGSSNSTATTPVNTGTYTQYEYNLNRPGGGSWTESDLNNIEIALGMYSTGGTNTRCTQFYLEIDYTYYVTVTYTGITSNEYKIEMIMDTSTLDLEVDDVVQDTTSITSISASDNSTDWIFMEGSAYSSNITIDVDGVQELYYAPITIISGSTLPDRAGAAHDGTITWGTTPAGVTISSLGSMIYADQPSPVVSGLDGESPDIIPRGNTQELDIAPGVPTISGLTEFMAEIATNTGFSQMQLWVMLAVFLTLIATCAAGAFVPGHLLVMGVINMGCVVTWWQLGVFPYWVLIISGMVLIGTLVSERTPAY